MAITSLSLNLFTQPIDTAPGEQATVTYGISGGTNVNIEIFAEPAGGGTPIKVGTLGGNQFVTSGSTQLVNLNTAALNPAIDYNFYALEINTSFQSATIGPLDVTCFAAGTLIATDRGEIPVEHLRAGDLVLTAQGFGAPLQPVRWVGRMHVNIARHPAPAKAAPILIKAGALAEGVPARDLRVSPEHALFLDERLVPAHLLVNGTSIVQELWCREVTYVHVELPAHGLLIAEGAPTESYFDDGNRHLFDNSRLAAVFADFLQWRAGPGYDLAACFPPLREGPALERIRLRIAQRAAAGGRPHQDAA
jgi:hypothetical protein